MRSIKRPLVTLALPLAFAGCATAPSTVPPVPTASGPVEIPSAIAVPNGNRLAATLKGNGLQNYECRVRADAPGGYDWVFVAPDAALKDTTGALVGKHYGGPTWEHGDGSKVTGKVVATSPAPQAGNIPWLLLQGTPASTPGMLAGVTYVQRVATSGGAAPSDACTAQSIGTKASVRYAADYLFYKS